MADDFDAQFDAWVGAHAGVLHRCAVVLLGRSSLPAEDEVQEVLIAVYRRWRRRGWPEYPLSYALTALTRRCARTAQRAARQHRMLTAISTTPTPLDEDPPLTDEVLDALRDLPAGQREVVVLRFVADLGVSQTATLLRISDGTVKSQTSRALATLRTALAGHPAAITQEGRTR